MGIRYNVVSLVLLRKHTVTPEGEKPAIILCSCGFHTGSQLSHALPGLACLLYWLFVFCLFALQTFKLISINIYIFFFSVTVTVSGFSFLIACYTERGKNPEVTEPRRMKPEKLKKTLTSFMPPSVFYKKNVVNTNTVRLKR